MIKNLNKITSLLLLLVFLLPSIIKLEHHHEDIIYKAVHEKQFNVFHEKCAICNFEFSAYMMTFNNSDFQKENPLDNYSNKYNSKDHSNRSQFSFLLRAPPYRQI